MSSADVKGAQGDALAQLLSRYSPWPLTSPAPDRDALGQVMAAALRAPDHGQLKPWRCVVIEGEARHAFGEVLVQAARRRDPDDDGERFRAKALAAPVIIALGAHIEPGHKVPEIEQILAAGAGVMNMLNALHFMGYGGFWATGLNAYDEGVKSALGFDSTDRLLGWLYVGTPAEEGLPPERVAPDGFVREWHAPAYAGQASDSA